MDTPPAPGFQPEPAANRGLDRGPAPWNHVSSPLEKVIEYLFLGELLRALWRKGRRDVEVLRVDVDSYGYDLVIECNGFIRHIQLKASFAGSTTAKQKINTALSRKASGCVIWIDYDPTTMQLGPFRWFGDVPGSPLPNLGEKIARHTKGDRTGAKGLRTAIRLLNGGAFERVADIDGVALKLFGI